MEHLEECREVAAARRHSLAARSLAFSFGVQGSGFRVYAI